MPEIWNGRARTPFRGNNNRTTQLGDRGQVWAGLPRDRRPSKSSASNPQRITDLAILVFGGREDPGLRLPRRPPNPRQRASFDTPLWPQALGHLHNSAPRESVENKCPTPIATSNPFRRRAILASSRQCLPQSAVPRSARQPAGSLHNRITSPRMIALPPSFLPFVRLIRNAPPAPVATGSTPLPPADFRWLLYVNSLILKTKMGLFGQNWVQRQTHNSAQFCTILPNRAQPGSDYRRYSIPHRPRDPGNAIPVVHSSRGAT